MQQIAEHTIVRAELEELRQVRAVLSDSLAHHAAQLKSTGALPPEDLLDQLLNYRSRLLKLSAGLAKSTTGDAANPASNAELSLDGLQRVLEHREAQERRGATLTQVLHLAHTDDAEFAPLKQCQAQASQWMQLSQANSPEPTLMADLDRALPAFDALLMLAQTASEISDEAWTAYHEQVTATWGRGLSTALARGKIHAVQEVTQQPILEVKYVPTPEAEAAPVAPSTPFETVIAEVDETPGIVLDPEFEDPELEVQPENSPAAEADDVDSVFDNSQDMVFDAVGKPGAERAPSRRLRSLDLKLLSDEPYQWLKSPPARATTARTTTVPRDAVAELARRALQANPKTRDSEISELVLQLLGNDRPGAAYQLARCASPHISSDIYLPPTWLLHATTLSHHLCYSNGEMARLIEQDLEQFQPAVLDSADPLTTAANGFLVRAAALLPALLTASPAAEQIIKSFRISPGLSHLYNYCGRILTYGQQLQGQAADLFTPDCDNHRWTAAVDELKQAVESWLPDTANRFCPASKSPQFFVDAHWTLTAGTSVRHELATRRWGKWQEVLRIVYRLLAPVRAADQSGRNWVKSEVERLSHAIQLESAANQTTDPKGEVLLFPEESMLTVIREAIDFANRWLRLCAARPDQGRTLMSRDAELLRDEILERTDGVVAELEAYSRDHDAHCVRAGIACLCRTIEHLRMIFSPHSTLPLREAAPRDVLSRELQDIPHLEFDDQGLPTLAASDLETVLLTYLSGASREQFEQLEYRVTARILESNARHHAQKLEALGPCRSTEVSDSCWE